MKNYQKIFTVVSIFTILLQGCGTNEEKITIEKTYPTAIRDAASITVSEQNSLMSPSIHALEEVANIVGDILKIDIIAFNKEEFKYCDISGEKELTESASVEQFIHQISYQTCKDESTIQDGEVELSYTLLDADEKYPKRVQLLVKNDYRFNDLLLKKGTLIKSEVLYKENLDIENISLTITGEIDFDHQTLLFRDFEFFIGWF